MRKIIIYWRDIPSMVTIKKGREKGKAMLPERFQEAIDRAAMRAGKGSSSLYIEEWRSVTEDIDYDGDLLQLATAEASALADSIDDELLKVMVRNNGLSAQERVE
jgi:hypothetical protein